MSKYRDESEINEIIVHCSDSPNGRNDTIADIDLWHKARNFRRNPNFIGKFNYIYKYVGYHLVIDLRGNVANGRRLTETGAHAYGHNTRSIGICLIGRDKFTKDQWRSLEDLMNYLLIRYPGIKILGHNEISSKTCPGFNVQNWLKNQMEPCLNRIYYGEDDYGKTSN